MITAGYQCSRVEDCPNPVCGHKRPHLAKYIAMQKRKYKTCAGSEAFCPVIHDYVRCVRVREFVEVDS